MKAAIHNPYLDTLGGGERYALSFAKVLSDNGWDVDVEWKDEKIKKISEKRFGMDLGKINIVPDVKRGDGYDLCFWVSDGSIPTLKSRKNILHFQVPFHNVGGNSLLNKMKLFRIDNIVCNSNFTKKVIDSEYGVESTVLYPPVPATLIKSKRKENLIIYVGRFSPLLQSKRQDILVKAFRRLFDNGFNDWKLVLAGGAELGVGDYLESLKKMSVGYPIKIIKSPDFKTLKDLYGRSRIFWSAAGYHEDEGKSPEKVEHFGMTVVEAMSAGAVPVVYDSGGHKEIVKNGINGFVWESISTLVSKTKKIITGKGIYSALSKNAKNDSLNFSYENFEKEILSIIR